MTVLSVWLIVMVKLLVTSKNNRSAVRQHLINNIDGVATLVKELLNVLSHHVDQPLPTLRPLPPNVRRHEEIGTVVDWVVNLRGLGGALNVEEGAGDLVAAMSGEKR